MTKIICYIWKYSGMFQDSWNELVNLQMIICLTGEAWFRIISDNKSST